ncbi:hypothetical protein AwDysgo_15580 [Bacteroidales bacterium]|nr:hypothetical protein AwDysgo_15580 [Bacteroidales bacterium]
MIIATPLLAQITLNVKNQTLKDVLTAIENKTDYKLLYNAKFADLENKISLNVDKESIDVVMTKLLTGTQLRFEKKANNQIVLVPRASANEAIQPANKKTIGTIIDENGEPIIGASVVVKGTTLGTVTDIDGKFELATPENSVLVFTYLGYSRQEMRVSNQKSLSVKLIEDTQSLDEVVVIGYGTQRKGNIATSISSVRSEVLQNRPTSTLGEALQGQVAGLSIVSTSRPGSSPSIQLRGATSLNGGGSPLVLVDGVPSDFNFLNTEDIESINVLKDAASAAIYGSRAANGVMLITNKYWLLTLPG